MEHSGQIFTILEQTYPTAQCELIFKTPWQLLLATILSAQCTDVRVNIVTKILFQKYPLVEDILELDIEELKELIRSAGFYNQKARYIKAAAAKVVYDFKGMVPNSMAELITIPGVARKTANVVLGVGFGINEGVAVDTHVIRLSQLLGLSKYNDPVKIEKDLMKLFKRKDWEKLSTMLVLHGRRVCKARKPDCAGCPLNKICPAAFQV